MGERIIKPIHNIFKQYKKVNLVNPYWFQKAFVSTWKTDNTTTGSSTSTQIKLPLMSSGTYNFVVNWGDGLSDTITVWNAAATTHTYSVAGTYTVRITGVCNGWSFNATGDRAKILTVTSWGKLGFINAFNASAFNGCSNLTLLSISDVPMVTSGTNLSLGAAFQGCTAITTIDKLNNWDVSGVSNFSATFNGCTNFDTNIGNWNTSSGTTFQSLFNNCQKFNNGGSPTINNWNTGNVTNMSATFFQCTLFNQPVGNWNTVKVNTFSQIFQNCSNFNQNLGAWSVSLSSSFLNMFQNNFKFNNGGSPTINNWVLKTTGTVDFTGMFINCSVFNQPIGNWNTSAVTTMLGMLQNCVLFNQDIGNWNVSKVTTMINMLNGCTVFNNGGSASINNWNVGLVQNFTSLFTGAIAFNQPLGNWNTISATSMASMFNNATAFNQDIGNWDIRNVTIITLFMQAKSPANFSAANLDAIYNGWSSRPVKPSLTISFNTIKYTAAGSAGKAILTGSPNLWSITDGGI